MIQFQDISNQIPYLIFKEKYYEAINAGQKNIEAVAISSFDKKLNEVESRFVNLKFINDINFIFFSNYNSPKSKAFSSHNQIAAVFYWPSINVQIRMKAKIKKTSNAFNKEYFYERSEEKNALAISSDQSKQINSYIQVKENFNSSLKKDDLKKCPKYWGGYSFLPYYFEFWTGHESRINKREIFEMIDDVWNHSFLQP